MIRKSIGAYGLPFVAEAGISAIVHRWNAELRTYHELADYLSAAPKHDLLILSIARTIPAAMLDYLHRHQPHVLLILRSDECTNIRSLTAKGITAMIVWDCPEEEVINAIEMGFKGKKYFCDRLLRDMLHKESNPDQHLLSELTEREAEVLMLIAKGKTTNEIAEALHLSNHTINSHRKNILKKLNLKHPPQLISFAWKHGLVQPS